MTDFRSYNPCQFFLTDSTNDTLTRGMVGSAIVEITDEESVPSATWNETDQAPVSTAWPKSGAEGLGAPGKYLILFGWAGLLAMGMSLL